MVAEVESSNRLAIEMRKERIEKEKEEEARINEYNRLRFLREIEEHKQALLTREKKEREIQHLREAQEQAQNRQSEID